MSGKDKGASASGVDPSRTCGTCGLWGRNFYPRSVAWLDRSYQCAADAVMDLPASFIPKRQTMTAGQGEGCICWQPCDGDGSGEAGTPTPSSLPGKQQ